MLTLANDTFSQEDVSCLYRILLRNGNGLWAVQTIAAKNIEQDVEDAGTDYVERYWILQYEI